MGITGLLPMLEKSKASRPANINEFKGCTVAADAYCWLHKGAFSCADKLARGEQTDMYVQYCMKYVNMLLANDIKPILVFDGRHLPAKAQTEKKRRERRAENRKVAANLLRQGNTAEGLSYLRRCIDVTHKMALTLMQECRKRNVDCIVAPYEADAQLAFFSMEGIADLIITEDSDLMLFGCKKVIFKLDLAGKGVLVEQERLYLSMGPRPESFSFDKFRYMCILSGCDYLQSLPGIGLGKACKFVSRTQDPDIHKALTRLPSQLNIRGLSVSMEYRDEFMKADAMFKHQLVFDPILRKTRPLKPHQSVHPGSPLAGGPLPGCIPEFDEQTSYQLALGNLDPFNLEKVDDYDPEAPRKDNEGVKTKGWSQTAVAPHSSIWDPQFMEKIAKSKPRETPSFLPNEARPITKDKVQALDTDELMKNKKKRLLEEDDSPADVKRRSIDPRDSMLTAIYTAPVSTNAPNDQNLPSMCDNSNLEVPESPTSPVLCGKRSKNPFARNVKNEDAGDSLTKEIPSKNLQDTPVPPKQPSKFGALSKFAHAVRRTSTEGKPIVRSRYFDTGSLGSEEEPKNIPSMLQDVSNTLDDGTKNELNMMQIYRKSSEEQMEMDSPKVHKKPLFASNSPKDVFKDGKRENTSQCSSLSKETVLKSMNEKFGKPDSGFKLKISPTKNPFKKTIRSPQKLDENCAADFVVSCMNDHNNHSRLEQTNDKEDGDDLGFESSTSLTPCSPIHALSQPDDGFESPSKTLTHVKASPSSARKSKTPTPQNRKTTCRTPGLKKPPSSGQGQFKLSAFGFVPKPKLERS